MTARRAQRPQGPPEARPLASASTEIEDVADEPNSETAIRDIGKGFRWYDLPYLVLRSLQRSNVDPWIPARWRVKIREISNFLYQTHHTRERRGDNDLYRFDKIELPSGEGVTMPYASLVEYFTASGVRELHKAIRRSGWDGARFLGMDPGGTETVTSSRRGDGRTWWRMAELTSRSAEYTSIDAQRAKLPAGVKSISLIGVSIGKGVTAVVAGFSLDESVSARLNEQLRAPHQHDVIRRKGQMAVSQPPKAVLHYRTQRARSEVHRELRRWMSRTLPGAFASARHPQPLFDVIFFNVADHMDDDARPSHRENDALRAMGLQDHVPYRVTSEELPGLLLQEPVARDWAPDISENVWSLWGNRDAAARITSGTGHSGVESAGYFVGSRSTDFMARSGLTAFLRLLRGKASIAHDNARELHGGTSSRDLKRLRIRTLTTSLDLATLEEDIKLYNRRRWRDREPVFYLDYTAWFKERDKEEGRKPFKPVNLNAQERKVQRRLARELVEFDAEYREVLSTVASLGASLDSRRVQRVAIWVSVVSVVVALVTLWATQESPPDLVAVSCSFLRTLGWGLC